MPSSADLIELKSLAEGILLPVRAQPGARREGVTGTHAGQLKVAVSAPPDKGRANERLAEVLAEVFGLRASDVAIRHGATSRQKMFLLKGASEAQIRSRLRILLGDVDSKPRTAPT